MLISAIAMAACGGPQLQTKRSQTAPLPERPTKPHAAQAQVGYILELAQRSQTPDRHKHQLEAAELLFDLGEMEELSKLLAQIDVALLDDDSILRRQNLVARLALKNFLPDKALLALESASYLKADSSTYLVEKNLKAEAYEQLHRTMDSVRERTELAQLLPSGKENLTQQIKILQSLFSLEQRQITHLLAISDDGVMKGWLELVDIARSNYGIQQRNEKIDRWLLDYSDLKIDPALFNQVVNPLTATSNYPQQIGVILPLSGNLGHVANLVLDGILTAYHRLPGKKPTLRIYDSGVETPITELYQQALAEGAKFVIGPLEKIQVATLINAQMVTVPTLMLNTGDREIAALQPQIYQITLAPDNEIDQILKLAWDQGHRRALLFYPDTEWGRNMQHQFDQRWLALGGSFASQKAYANNIQDFAELLKKTFGLNQSRARAIDIERMLGANLDFTPRRRQDFEAIFLVSLTEQGRLLAPQFKVHWASEIPVYSTSHIFSGVSDPARDKDLDGIYFCDTPWVLGDDRGDLGEMRALSSNDRRTEVDPRLFALGVDAFQVYPYLENLHSQKFRRYAGLTGKLSLASDQVIERALPCALFKAGVPKTVSRLDSIP